MNRERLRYGFFSLFQVSSEEKKRVSLRRGRDNSDGSRRHRRRRSVIEETGVTPPLVVGRERGTVSPAR